MGVNGSIWILQHSTKHTLFQGELTEYLRPNLGNSSGTTEKAVTTWHPSLGTYWACGQKTFTVFPSDGQGVCFWGWVTPAIRIVNTLPTGRHRNKCNMPKILTVTVPLINGETVIGAIFFWVGVAMNHRDISLLAATFNFYLP